MVRDLLLHLDIHKSLGSNGIDTRLEELREELTKLFSVIYKWPWLIREVPVDPEVSRRKAQLQEG